MKVVVVQADGLADETSADLGGRTPLEVARTPHLDRMASSGILGLTRTIPRGWPGASEVGSLSVVGYDPQHYRFGRAVLEAIGLGITLGADDVAFRYDLVATRHDEQGAEIIAEMPDGSPTLEEGRALIGDLARAIGGAGFELHHGGGARHLLVWHGGCAELTTTPLNEAAGGPAGDRLPAGPGSDAVTALMARSRDVLARHPVCAARRERGEPAPSQVWVWGHGRRLDLPSINERFHVEGAVIAAVALPRGVGRAAGLRVVEVPGISGGLDSNFRGKVEYGLRSLGERAFLLLHVGAADEDGHGGDLHRKVEAIERIDAEVIGPLLGGLTASGDDWRMLVMPDRFTATGRRLQTDDPVPFAVSVARDAGKSRGAARAFTEKDARDAGIFIPEAHTLMERLLRR